MGTEDRVHEVVAKATSLDFIDEYLLNGLFMSSYRMEYKENKDINNKMALRTGD